MSKCEWCDKKDKLIEPFWDGEPHHLILIWKKREPDDLSANFPRYEKTRCKNITYNDDNIGCPGCGGQRGHWGECK